MEENKWRFLASLLSCCDTSLDLCISEMKLLEETTRRCYSETFENLDSHAFVEMMLLDGCFLLEYFFKSYERNWNSISEVGWNSYFIESDFLLQENQIPFFIVDKLYELCGCDQEFRMRFVKYIACKLLPDDYILLAPPAETPDTIDSIVVDPPAEIPNPLDKISDPPDEIHHLVHLCYHYLVPNTSIPVVLNPKPFDLTKMFSANRIIKGLLLRFRSSVLSQRSPHSASGSSSKPLPNSTGNISPMVVRSTTELKQKGLKFTQQSNPRHILDISFEYDVLKIPKLEFTDNLKPLFTNLLAFEHSKYGKKHSPFGIFLSFLDKLVNTTNDVTILQECGILENWLGSEEELAHFLNNVTEYNFLSCNHYLKELYTEVNRYTESSWHRISSPWATIYVVAAFILLVLTLVQSFFAVFSYIRPSIP